MSLRTTERIFITSSLALMLAAGCGDGDHAPTLDAGSIMDASRPKDAAQDTSMEEDLPSMSCGGKKCTGANVSQTIINPCCVPETDGCGLNADDLRRANSSTPFTGCVPKDVPASIENSVYCGEFWDQVEMVKKTNGGLDIASGSVTLTFDGCCLPSGECGALINTPRNGDPEAINTHLGCVSFGRLQEAFAAADAATMDTPAHLPFCNPSTGESPMGTETVTGVPKFVCGCGVGNLYDPMDTTRTFQCLNNLPTTVCGADEPSDAILGMVPEFICGCSTDSKLPCMTNVDKAVCGKKEIDANSAELARIPSFICGGAAQTDANGLPALKGVDAAVCGKKTPTAADLAMVPQFICGETGNTDTRFPKLKNSTAATCGGLTITNGSPYIATVPEFICGCPDNPTFPCMRNVATGVCGGKAVASGSTDLAQVPEYVCGCGADTVDPHTSIPCLSHVENNVCGAVEVTANTALGSVPKVLCGCGDGTIAARCLPNVPANLCGTADATAALAGLPDSLCGCGENVLAAGRPCLNNVATTSCGGLDVPTSQLTYLPGSLCGCGTSVTYDPGTFPTPCLSKSAPNECGGGAVPTSDPNNTPSNTADDCFTGIAAYVRGCGVGVAENTTARTCLPNGANTMFGCNQPAAGPTIAGQPKYACGCGVGAFPTQNPAECIPNVSTTTCGAADPTPTQLGGLPTYLCGCGASVPSKPNATTSLPCLSYLATTTCGAGSGAVNTGYLARFPASLCGCGGSTTYNPANPAGTPVPCLSNQANTVCGTNTIPTTTRTSPLPTCYTGWPEYVRGCGTSTPAAAYPPTCIPNGDNTLYGCTDVTANVAGQATFLCGCGENVALAGAPCLPNVGTQYCGSTAALDASRLASLPSSLCGCGSTSTTWIPGNPAFAAGPCLSKTIGATCGGLEYCDENAAAGTAPCTGAQQCVDARGGAGAGPYGAGGALDGLGDTCQ